MTQFKGFKTKEAAKAFQKKHGGILCWAERTPKRKQLTARGIDYYYAVHLGGLDEKRFPYCVQWNV